VGGKEAKVGVEPRELPCIQRSLHTRKNCTSPPSPEDETGTKIHTVVAAVAATAVAAAAVTREEVAVVVLLQVVKVA